MKRWLWFISSLLISTGVYFTIRYGLRPKPIPVLNATQFENAEQIGAVIYKRLRQEILVERVILLGSVEGWSGSQNLWTGFLKTAHADGLHIEYLYNEEKLPAPANVGKWDTVAFNEFAVQSGALSANVMKKLAAGKLLVIHGLTTEVSHLVKDSLSRALDTAAQHPVLSLSILTPGLKPEDLDNLQAQCLEPQSLLDGAARLSCAEARVSKVLLKKHLVAGHMWAVMERHGLKEFLIFVQH